METQGVFLIFLVFHFNDRLRRRARRRKTCTLLDALIPGGGRNYPKRLFGYIPHAAPRDLHRYPDGVVAVPNNEDMGKGDAFGSRWNAIVTQVTSSAPAVRMFNTALLTRNSSFQPLSPIASFASVPLPDGCERPKQVQSRSPSGFGRCSAPSTSVVDARRQRSKRSWSPGSAPHGVPLQALCVLSLSSMAVAAPTTMVVKRSSGGSGNSMIKIIVSRA